MSKNAKQDHSDQEKTHRLDGKQEPSRSDRAASPDEEESVWRPAELKPSRHPLPDLDKLYSPQRLTQEQSQEQSQAEPTRRVLPSEFGRSEPTRRLSRPDIEEQEEHHEQGHRMPEGPSRPPERLASDDQRRQRRPSSAWEPTQRIPSVHPIQDSASRSPSPDWDQPTVATRPPQQPPPGGSYPPAAGSELDGGGFSWAHALLWLTLIGVIVFFMALLAASVGYIVLAAQLPSPDELRAREPDFASSRIYDRDGRLLYEIMDPNTGKRTYVPISQISRSLQLATVATEDRNFYDHVGFDPFAIARAVFYALQEREIVSGASTITQQVARNILLDPEERTEVSASRKIKEIVLAAELSRKYSKEEILEIYLNNNNYGNLAYGVDAAARTYFGTTAGSLTLSQAAFLAGLPQSPATYDPYGGGLDAALKRQRTVLSLMVEAGFITQEQANVAAAEMEVYQFPSIYTDRIPAPHFVFYVRQWVEENLGADLLYQGGGLRIHTTLDAQLQTMAEQEVAQGVAGLAGRHVTNGALVAIEPPTGYILAMVGSVDFYDQAKGGQVNVMLRCRQPGSAIKPLTYLSAFEKGWTPARIVWDVPTTYTDTAGNIYQPVNYDGKFRGATSVRTALANSLNIPAVRTLEFVSVAGLLEMADRLGVTSIVSPQIECPDYPYDTRPLYGLALTLGGGEVKPLELTAAYATLANNGAYLQPTPILWIEDSEGNLLVDHRTRKAEQVVSPQHAYLVTHILADTQARCLAFRCPSILELPDRPVAAKTGTTNDNRDAWTMGYTPDLAVGVWVGNNDNSEMAGVVGSSGAGPIWNAFMQRAHEGVPPHPFPQPAGIIERNICTISGTEPGRYCPEQRREIFYQKQLPPGEDKSWFQSVKIDAASGLRANAFCTTNVVEKVMLILDPNDESMTPNDPRLDPQGRRWLEQWAVQNNLEIAPKDYCTEGEQEPTVRITKPGEREAVAGSVEIRGTADIPEFDHYEITYGVGDNPQGWGWISGPHEAIVRDGLIGIWEAGGQEPGIYTVRVVAYNKRGTQFESRVVIALEVPTPSPTPTLEDTMTPAPTPTLLPSSTPTATPTNVPTLVLPTATPTLRLPTPTTIPATATPTLESPTATVPPVTETPTSVPVTPSQEPTPESTPTLVQPVTESPTPPSDE